MSLDYFNGVDGYGSLDTEIFDGIQKVNYFSEQGNFNILHFNIRSIRKNFDELILYLEQIELNNIDILVLSETFRVDNLDHFKIRGFNSFYNESLNNKNDGLILYVRDTINAKCNNYIYHETTILRCILKVNGEDYGLSACYRSPNLNLSSFLDDLQNHFGQIEPLKTEIFIGDLNINIKDKKNFEVNTYLNVLSENGLFSCINKPTRESEVSSTIIDHLFLKTTDLDNKKDSIKPFIIRSSITDHYCIGLSIINKKISDEVNKTHNKREINHNKLFTKLKTETWRGVYEADKSVETIYETFISKLLSNVNQCTIENQINSKNKKRKPWVTQGIVKSIEHRDNLKKQLIKNYTSELATKYKEYRNFLHKLIKITKNTYYINKISDYKKDYKKLWQTINSITDSNRNKFGPRKFSIFQDDKCCDGDEEVANAFNEFFTNIPMKTKNSVDQNLDLPNSVSQPMKHNNSIFLNPVTEDELFLHIKSLKAHSAPGEDGIAVTLIQKYQKFLIKPLVYIYNKCIESSMVPSAWKISIVTPIFKTGDQSQLTNYRPISVISNFAKIFEKCIKQRLEDFFEGHNILFTNQFGFRKKRSTEDAIFELIKDVYIHNSNNKKDLMVFLDISKAFDRVDHNILLDRLEKLGIRGGPLLLLQNYLTGRRQKVKINDKFSNYASITTGVPQGTVLGPILFLAYINQIGSLIPDCNVVSYADDTALLFSSNSWKEVYNLAEIGLEAIYQWLGMSRLDLNFEKTKFMTISPTNANQPKAEYLTIHVSSCNNKKTCNCIKIKRTKTIKYLGIIVDQNLKWSEHAIYLTSKIRKIMYKFFQLREILDRELILLLYRSLVESILRYGIVVWGGLYDANLKILSTCQNSILKILSSKPRRYPTLKLYEELNILNIRNLYILSCLTYLPKIYNCFPVILHDYSTRTNISERLYMPGVNNSFCSRFVTFFLPKFYNVLPSTLKELIMRGRNRRLIRSFIEENKERFAKVFSN